MAGGSNRRRLKELARSLADRISGGAGPRGPAVVELLDRAGVVHTLRPVPGDTVLAAALGAGVDIDHFCGGQASCGTCHVQVLEGAEGLTPMESREELVLGTAKARASGRLACRARVRGGTVRLKVPRWF